MPKISFKNLPASGLAHIKQRAAERKISVPELLSLQRWVESEPEAPEGDWWKDFGSFKLCGSGDRPATILAAHMRAYGTKID